MEYVRGETLAARLHTGPLPAGEVLKIAIQLTDALAEAHGMGVVHRDLKPGCDGLDDGDPHGADAPAQRKQRRSAAGLGCIVFRAMSRLPQDRYDSAYEMAADLRRAVAGVEAAVGDARLGEAPTKSRAPQPRFGAADRTRRVFLLVGLAMIVILVTFRIALVGLLGPSAPAHIRSLAVLPLENLSGDPAGVFR
jgi:hypothetical protein